MTMKRFFAIVCTIFAAGAAFAQGPADALMLSQTQYEGTARTLAMGNAFTALGGDLGAIAVNPASSGIYRCNEFTFSPEFVTAGGNTLFNGSENSDKSTRFALSNTGFVTSMETGKASGILNFNFGFTVNRTNNFNKDIWARGVNNVASKLGSIAAGLAGVDFSLLEKTDTYEPYNNGALPWNAILAYDCYLIDPEENFTDSYIAATENYADDGSIGVGGNLLQEYYSRTYGGTSEISFNFGANYNDFLYFGANLNLVSVDYTVYDRYAETAVSPSQFQDGFVSMSNTYWQNTGGAGVSLKFGAICTPVEGLRLGATFTTPTWYSLSDNWQYGMTSNFDNGNRYEQNSPMGSYDYKVTTPMRWSLGAAYTFGGLGLISVDYEGVNYSAVKMSDYYGSEISFTDANSQMRRGFGYAGILRAGAEVWLGGLAVLRAGYNHYDTPGSLVDNTGYPYYNYPSTDFISCGFGFKLGEEGRTRFDVAYQTMLKENQVFAAFDSYAGIAAPSVDFNRSLSKLVLTLALRF